MLTACTNAKPTVTDSTRVKFHKIAYKASKNRWGELTALPQARSWIKGTASPLVGVEWGGEGMTRGGVRGGTERRKGRDET